MQAKNIYLDIFYQWVKNLNKSVIKNCSIRGSQDQGWIGVEFDIKNYTVDILLNNDPVQIYDRIVHRKEDSKYLQTTDAVAEFTPELFKSDLDNLYMCLELGKIEEYFERGKT